MTDPYQPFDNQPLHERLDINFALQSAGLGVWELDPVTNLVLWDDRCRQLFGLATDNQLPFEEAIQYIHPEDVTRVTQAVQWAHNPASGGTYDVTYRTLGADDGLLRWVRFWGQSYFTPAGELYRFSGVAQEVTQQIKDQQTLIESEARFRSLIEEAPVATMLMSGPNHVIELANQQMMDMLGKGGDMLSKPAVEAVPELATQAYLSLLDTVFTSGQLVEAKAMPGQLVNDEVVSNHYFDFTYKPLHNGTGAVYGILAIAVDVTQQEVAHQKLTQSESRFRTLAEQAPIFVFESDVDATVVYWNLRWLEFVGQSEQEALGRDGWPKVMHPDDYDRLLTTYIQATAAKESYEIAVRVRRKDGIYRTVLFTGKPRYTLDGEFNGYIGNGIDISTQVENQLVLAESEAKLRAILDNARAAIGVYVGRDMLIENPNQVFIDILGKGPDIAGKPLGEVLPELETESQPFLAILDEVYTTGIGYSTTDTLIKIFRNGELTNNYYNFSYTPVLDLAGKTYEIVVVAIDVTEQIQVRQALEEKEATLRGAIELAAMGTWALDMHSGVTTYSDKLKQLFEFNQDFMELDRLYNPILEADRARLEEAVIRAARADSNGLLDEEYTIITQRTGRHRIVRAQAKMFFDPNGQPTKLVGSMRDVTEERQTQLALEQLVQERTEQLAAANEELAATNDELEANNEEVEESNRLLARSNDNLQKFAYVASHDLQEPLRKIQQFGDLLKARQASLSSDDINYIDRMQAAASRMATLIRDLLNFSRISTQRDKDDWVPLNGVVEQVLITLELVTAETNASVTVEPLPTVQGDAIQLAQLFQNLISNALKFRRSSVAPVIQIITQTVSASELPAVVKPLRASTAYYQIDVADNGVGFDEKYLDRIFEVFQRLHGRNEFAGTGIGLAICERVVANHGGAITASSQPGQGSTFSIYLPIIV